MTDRNDERRRQQDYLLGKLTDTQAEAIESRYFDDADYFESLESVVDDLVDDYAHRRLSAADRERFVRHCLGSRDDRLRLRVITALESHAARTSASPASADDAPKTIFGFRGWAPWAFAGACVVLLGVASVLTMRVSQLRDELTQARNDVAAQRRAAGDATSQVQQERTRREAVEQRLNGLLTVSFVLAPGLSRGADSELAIAKGAEVVRFSLALDRDLATGRYRVLVRTTQPATVWSGEVIVTAERASSLDVSIPSAVLTPGQFEAVVQSVSTAGAVEEVATYGFRVARR